MKILIISLIILVINNPKSELKEQNNFLNL